MDQIQGSDRRILDRSVHQGMMGRRGDGDQRWGCCWVGDEDVLFYPKAHKGEQLESQ